MYRKSLIAASEYRLYCHEEEQSLFKRNSYHKKSLEFLVFVKRLGSFR